MALLSNPPASLWDVVAEKTAVLFGTCLSASLCGDFSD
jgi:hypothetical protein